MKLFEIRDGFGFENLKLAERSAPEPAADEVVVRIRAVSLNFRDLLVVQGKYNPRMKLPRVPLSDGAGEVASVGAAITAWKTGDRVMIPFMPGWLEGELDAEKAESALGGAVDGVLSEFIAIRAAALLPMPEHLSFEEAATLPCAAVTAWNGLFVSGNLQPGQTLFLQGTGGVSLFGLQFGKIAGAKMILISSSDEKLERARALGADETINYRAEPDWEKQVLALTDGRGVDLTLEVGGAGTLSKTLRATRYGGHVSLIGVLSGIAGDVQTAHILHKAITLRGIYVGSKAMFAAMSQTISQHRLKPMIDRVFPCESSPEALRHLESGRHFGKIVMFIP
ncbi:MAG TPA: NAD(P)-dependent alcohol dehydrogenase [Candidatus Methylacidiphilales bacterium]|nr:NAD(P)-dependent alcohol dehydrogenase [Candidatus Methylacidiphilales bacterium]